MDERRKIIEVQDLTIRFGEKTILENVSFDIYEGEVFVVLGPSGCGKTTLLKHMVGLHRPASGSILINGQDIVQARDEGEIESILRSVGVLFQSGALFKSMTLGENVAMPLLEKTDLSDDMIEEIVRMKLAMVNLERRENLMPSEMSGGMQKRGGLARAIALDPEILFFDEPSAGLDPVTSVELDELILALNQQLGTTMIVVTHELQSIMKIAQRAIMLDNESKGIVAQGTPEKLMASEVPKVRAFFHRESIAEGS